MRSTVLLFDRLAARSILAFSVLATSVSCSDFSDPGFGKNFQKEASSKQPEESLEKSSKVSESGATTEAEKNLRAAEMEEELLAKQKQLKTAETSAEAAKTVETAKVAIKEPPKETSKETAKEIAKENVKETPKVVNSDAVSAKKGSEIGSGKKPESGSKKNEHAMTESKNHASSETKKSAKTSVRSVASKPIYVVQLGAFRIKENAEKFHARLKSNGHEAIVHSIQHSKNGELFLVRLEPTPNRAEAESAVAKLRKDEKLNPQVITEFTDN